MSDCHPVATLIAQNVKLQVPEEPELFNKYLKAIGSLMYATLGTCPDIAFAVHHLSQFTTKHTKMRFTAVKHVF